MYERHFKMHSRPFLAAPDASRYFPGAVIEHARGALVRCIERGDGPGLVVGPPGTGKSLLCQMLAREFADRYTVALLVSGRFGTRQALLQAISYELRLAFRGLEEGELRLGLLDHLNSSTSHCEGLLLLVDEAQVLPWKVLEEIRLLTNLARDGKSRVRVVLAGNDGLEERFASPRLSSFSQRLAVRCYLGPLDRIETADYVRAQIAAVGGDAARLFDEPALATVHRASDGIGRLINQVCDHALMLACLGGSRHVSSEAVDEAWADLQQLPAPWTAAQHNNASDAVVEFAPLDDSADEQFMSVAFPAVVVPPVHLAQPDEIQDECEPPHPKPDARPLAPITLVGEVELDFPEFGDPFGQQFAEEEVILERYAAETSPFAAGPRATSSEGQQLASILEPWTTGTSVAGSLRLGTILNSETSGEKRLAIDPPRGPAGILLPSGQTASVQNTVENALVVAGDARATGQAGTGIRRAFLDEDPSSQAVNGGIVVVEDAPCATVVSASPHMRPTAPNREYRQLFAKLRRGHVPPTRP
jgi:type II secretory pathway predicted ATPase ExeA